MRLPVRLVECSTGQIVVERLEIADGYWSRLVGLQLRSEPPRGFGLLLAPCSSIHTFLLRFPIDAVMLDRFGRVVKVRRGVRPWRVVLATRKTFAVLEVPSRQADAEIEAGMRLRLEGPADRTRRLSRSLTAWCESS
jgi:uncharacterized protein